MCGINGFTFADEETLRRMNKVTAHRGPDATGFYCAEGVSLGHNRLSIIDLSPDANQPMHSPDGRYTLVFNGEIYNYRELKNGLSSQWEFKTKSDSEVLLAGYACWGEEVLNKLRGMFAFALWDSKEKELLLVRDQMGIKPLYYAFKDGILYFSSELSGIIEGTASRTLSKESLALYLAVQYVPSPLTLVKDILSLRPAHFLRYRNGSIQEKRYWKPRTPSDRSMSPKGVEEVIDAAVKRQMVSDRPIGVLLSGGLDSSIVLHHAHKYNPSIETFSSSFITQTGHQNKYSTDAELAARTAKVYGVRHNNLVITTEDVAAQLPDILEKLDEPTANATNVSRYMLYTHMRSMGIVVGLGGDGADELFGGYDRYRAVLASSYFKKSPRIGREAIKHIYPRSRKLETSFGADMHYELMSQPEARINRLLVDGLPVEAVVKNFFRSRYTEIEEYSFHPVEQFMIVDRESWLVDESLAQTDITSMAHGFEMRVPFLDLDVVMTADNRPYSKKFSLLQRKRVLQDIYKKHLPEYIFKGIKRGWLSPGSMWLRDPAIANYVKEVFTDSYYPGLSSVINWDNVQKAHTKHINKEEADFTLLWKILLVQVWARKNNITV